MFLIHELKEGRQIGRAELYIAIHTRKNGQPIDDYSFEKIVCCFLPPTALLFYLWLKNLFVHNFFEG
jgi:hypothetical protein